MGAQMSDEKWESIRACLLTVTKTRCFTWIGGAGLPYR
jgi:hypothetical protein